MWSYFRSVFFNRILRPFHISSQPHFTFSAAARAESTAQRELRCLLPASQGKVSVSRFFANNNACNLKSLSCVLCVMCIILHVCVLFVLSSSEDAPAWQMETPSLRETEDVTPSCVQGCAVKGFPVTSPAQLSLRASPPPQPPALLQLSTPAMAQTLPTRPAEPL